MVSRPVGMLSGRFFMKQGAGPGWALVGDSGLHLNPTPGLGITDAARDAVALSEAIIDGSERALTRYWRRRDTDSLGLYHFADDMGSEDYNNPFTQMVFRRAMNSPAITKRMYRMMDRDLRPQEMIPATTLLGWLLAESLSGNFAPWPFFGRALRSGLKIVRQQAILDRALANAERGDPATVVPSLAGEGRERGEGSRGSVR